MELKTAIEIIQKLANKLGANLSVDGQYGPKTDKAVAALLGIPNQVEQPAPGKPIYPAPHPHHRFFKVAWPFTHAHPFDVMMSIVGTKEVAGQKDNPLIAHFHEHSGNLGSHSDGNDYSDEVPWCSSVLNWAADMSGCRKTNNALAASWKKYGNDRKGDWVEKGDIVVLGTRHVTLAAKRFNRKTEETFNGFGGNQNNQLKTSAYNTSEISSVQAWSPLLGTLLAPIGTMPPPATGPKDESTK